MARKKEETPGAGGTARGGNGGASDKAHPSKQIAQAQGAAAALAYAKERGWHVFPADLSDGQKKSHKAAKYSNGRPWGATNDPEEIRRDFIRWPDAGIGIPTGAVNNIIVVDVDTLAGHGVDGLAQLRELEAPYGALPETLQAVTPTGGSHFYFQYPDDGTVIRTSTSRIAPGIDIIGEGGMVLAPPTVRPGVGAYHLVTNKPIAVMPGWLITLAVNANKFVGDAAANPELTTEPEIAAAAMAVIPNDDIGWVEWNRIGMACWCATGGSDEGLAAFDTWSQKSGKYNAATTQARWEEIKRSPPNRIGAGTIIHLANEADPDWGRRYDAVVKAKMDAANANARAQTDTGEEQQQEEKKEDDKQQEGEASSQLVLILELATKLWGAGQRISKGQWRFGANGEIAIDAFRAKWFNFATGAKGGLNELIDMAGNLFGATTHDENSVVIVRASDVVIRKKNWLWKGHLLRGALELLTGIPGLGKSQVQCSFIGCATKGLVWPDGTKLAAPVNVIMVTAEDTLDQEVVPRLIAANADLNKVHILKCIKTDNQQRQFLLAEDLDKITQAMGIIGNVGLITIDPITAYMGKLDSHKATDVRSQLGPLKDFAEAADVAVSAITHPPKSAGKRAIDHFIASQAFIAAARIGHACFEEMEDNTDTGENRPSGRILFTNPKNNPNEKMPTLAYRIRGGVTVGQDQTTRDTITSSHVVWEQEPVNISADAAVAAAAGGNKQNEVQSEVRKFLRDLLASGAQVAQKQIMDEGKQLGFSEKQIRTAGRKLNVTKTKSGFDGGWVWCLPL